jgi:ABC-type uncharacterized transport system permease subunit
MTTSVLGKLKSGLKSIYYPVAALVISLLIGSVVILLTSSSSPMEAYRAMLKGAFGTSRAWSETVIKAIPFMFTALSFAIARRCGIINLGAEGQFKVGALMATLVAVNFEGLPMALHLPLTLAAGFVGGAVYGLIVGLLKVRFGASELITTIMLNYVASQIIDFCVNGPMKDSANSSYPQSAQIYASAAMPGMFGSRLHWGLVLVVVMIVFYYFFLWKTTKGFEMRVVGLTPSAGAYAGMSPQAAFCQCSWRRLRGAGRQCGEHRGAVPLMLTSLPCPTALRHRGGADRQQQPVGNSCRASCLAGCKRLSQDADAHRRIPSVVWTSRR